MNLEKAHNIMVNEKKLYTNLYTAPVQFKKIYMYIYTYTNIHILKGWMQIYCLISRHLSLCGRIKGHFYFLHLLNILKFSTHALLLNEKQVSKEKRHHST